MKIQLSDHFNYKKLFRFVMPSIFMMVFISVYGVVDGLFVSHFVGKTAFASINFVFPFVMLLGGMGFMVGTGGSALVAKTLGEGDKERANKYFSMMIIFTVLFGVILTVFGVTFIRPISYFLGASDGMIEDCVTYGRIVILFTTAFMLQNVFQSFLIVAEKPELGLFATLAAGITNMLLDFLFVAVFKMGVSGAALATGISQCIGAFLPLVYFILPNPSLLRFRLTMLEFMPIIRACANGSSELMNNISSSFVGMLYNFQLMNYIGEDGVSAYGALLYVQFIFIAIYIGYVIGVSPIISYNFGSKNTVELRGIFKKSITVMLSLGVVLTALALSLAGVLAYCFVGYDAALFELTKHAFYLFSASFLLAGFNIFASSLFTALNNGLVSAIISFLRTLVFQSAAVLVLPLIFDADGIWLSVIIAEIFATVISVAFILNKNNQYGYFLPKSKQ